MNRIALIVCISLASVMFIACCSGGRGHRAQAKEEEVVEAREILRDYADNPSAADKKYKHDSFHKIRVRGTVDDFLGKIVLLERNPSISCFGLSSDEVADLSRGQTVTVEGSVSIGNSGGIHLSGCKVVK